MSGSLALLVVWFYLQTRKDPETTATEACRQTARVCTFAVVLDLVFNVAIFVKEFL